jgi:hypothetical protein
VWESVRETRLMSASDFVRREQKRSVLPSNMINQKKKPEMRIHKHTYAKRFVYR